jgi:UPF0716 family protein affecting phage T7 exclusion
VTQLIYNAQKKNGAFWGAVRSTFGQSRQECLVTMPMSAAPAVPTMAAMVMIVPAMIATVPAVVMVTPMMRVAMPVMVMTTGADVYRDGGRRRCRHGNRSRCKQCQDKCFHGSFFSPESNAEKA